MTIDEVKTMQLAPGDTLLVKIRDENISMDGLRALRENLEKHFPANKVLVFAIDVNSNIEFEVVKKGLEHES